MATAISKVAEALTAAQTERAAKAVAAVGLVSKATKTTTNKSSKRKADDDEDGTEARTDVKAARTVSSASAVKLGTPNQPATEDEAMADAEPEAAPPTAAATTAAPVATARSKWWPKRVCDPPVVRKIADFFDITLDMGAKYSTYFFDKAECDPAILINFNREQREQVLKVALELTLLMCDADWARIETCAARPRGLASGLAGSVSGAIMDRFDTINNEVRHLPRNATRLKVYTDTVALVGFVIKFFCRCGLDVELADDDAPRYQLIHVYPFGSDTETYAVTTQCPRTLPSVSFRSVPGIPRVVTGKIVHPAAPPPTPPVPPASDATATSSASAASAASTSTTTADKWWSLRACDPDDVRRIARAYDIKLDLDEDPATMLIGDGIYRLRYNNVFFRSAKLNPQLLLSLDAHTRKQVFKAALELTLLMCEGDWKHIAQQSHEPAGLLTGTNIPLNIIDRFEAMNLELRELPERTTARHVYLETVSLVKFVIQFFTVCGLDVKVAKKAPPANSVLTVCPRIGIPGVHDIVLHVHATPRPVDVTFRQSAVGSSIKLEPLAGALPPPVSGTLQTTVPATTLQPDASTVVSPSSAPSTPAPAPALLTPDRLYTPSYGAMLRSALSSTSSHYTPEWYRDLVVCTADDARKIAEAYAIMLDEASPRYTHPDGAPYFFDKPEFNVTKIIGVAPNVKPFLFKVALELTILLYNGDFTESTYQRICSFARPDVLRYMSPKEKHHMAASAITLAGLIVALYTKLGVTATLADGTPTHLCTHRVSLGTTARPCAYNGALVDGGVYTPDIVQSDLVDVCAKPNADAAVVQFLPALRLPTVTIIRVSSVSSWPSETIQVTHARWSAHRLSLINRTAAASTLSSGAMTTTPPSVTPNPPVLVAAATASGTLPTVSMVPTAPTVPSVHPVPSTRAVPTVPTVPAWLAGPSVTSPPIARPVVAYTPSAPGSYPSAALTVVPVPPTEMPVFTVPNNNMRTNEVKRLQASVHAYQPQFSQLSIFEHQRTLCSRVSANMGPAKSAEFSQTLDAMLVQWRALWKLTGPADRPYLLASMPGVFMSHAMPLRMPDHFLADKLVAYGATPPVLRAESVTILRDLLKEDTVNINHLCAVASRMQHTSKLISAEQRVHITLVYKTLQNMGDGRGRTILASLVNLVEGMPQFVDVFFGHSLLSPPSSRVGSFPVAAFTQIQQQHNIESLSHYWNAKTDMLDRFLAAINPARIALFDSIMQGMREFPAFHDAVITWWTNVKQAYAATMSPPQGTPQTASPLLANRVV